MVSAAFLCLGVPVTQARELTFEDRVKAQEAIERVYWLHRDADGVGVRPSFEVTVPASILARKVMDTLKKSAALERFWGRPVTDAQLQAEVDRMVRETQRAALLEELFAALDHDPLLIAECLARPILVNRLIRNWYAGDGRFHETVRRRAEAALEHAAGVESLKGIGDDYVETLWTLRKDAAVPPTLRRGEIVLDEDEWRLRVNELAAQLAVGASAVHSGPPQGSGSAPAPAQAAFLSSDRSSETELPLRRLSALQESDSEYFIVAVLDATAGGFRTAVASWPKKTFDDWWEEESPGLDAVGPRIASAFNMPQLRGGGCTLDTWRRTPKTDAPKERVGHGAVWTGKEMIVWGGYNGESGTSSGGGRYTPATDTWQATLSGDDYPEGRGGQFTTVWTGTEMIVWGGLPGPVNTGARYDPSTDSWTPTSAASGVPSPRYDHTAVWTGSRMIVWGGNDTNGQKVNSGGLYDPVSDTWTPTSTGPGVPAPRERHTAVWTGNEMIVWGGVFFNNLPGGIYNPATDTWRPVATTNIPCSRTDHTAVWTGTQMIVWGGTGCDGWENTGGRYDLKTDTWTPTSLVSAPDPRTDHTAVWTGHEMIVYGGDASQAVLRSGGRYDPVTDTWRPTSVTATAPSFRAQHTAIWTGTEMLVWGGGRIYPQPVLPGVGERYDPVSDTWLPMSTGPDMPPSTSTSVWTGSELIVWGSSGSASTPGRGGRLDLSTNTWTATSRGTNAPLSLTLYSLTWTGSDMIVWGGIGFDVTNHGARYDPVSDSWRPTSVSANVPAARYQHTALWTGSEMIVWGGNTFSSPLPRGGGRYDPVTDTWRATSLVNAPAGRAGHTAVWTGNEMIVWGGTSNGSSYLNDGGRYDPSLDKWAQVPARAGLPTGRAWHTAVWAGDEMIVWGGQDSNSALGDGGRYDPVNDVWHPMASSDLREEHGAVWTGARMLVWGGNAGDALQLRTGGRYDPASDTWLPTSVSDVTPIGRRQHATVWTGNEMIVWGGQGTYDYGQNSGGRYCACSGGDARTWYWDADGDGYGIAGNQVVSCYRPERYAAQSGDCDDRDPAIHPDAGELCDGRDNDCDGVVDEGPALCDDGNPCTDDSCLGVGGCVKAPAPNGRSCDDGNLCTVGDTCVVGVCTGAPVLPKISCNDHNACTQDYCDPDVGCMHAPIICNDHDRNTIDTCDPRRGCVFTPRQAMPLSAPTTVQGGLQ